jgi:hypothetical protein
MTVEPNTRSRSIHTQTAKETLMQAQLDRQTEADVTYWQSRVAGLELIVCELLTTNQQLRSDLQGSMAAGREVSTKGWSIAINPQKY